MNYERSDQIAELIKALVATQATMGAAAKDAKNPHFGSKYADLAACFDACKKALTDNGLAILQPATTDGPKVTVTTILAHTSGQWISCDLAMSSEKSTPQALGGCLTYARRYGLSSLIGLAADDDDGNEASGRDKGIQEPRGTRKAAQEVAERKLSEQKATVVGKRDSFTDLCEEYQKLLGAPMYDRILSGSGYEKASQVLTEKEQSLLEKKMAAAKIILTEASHGELHPKVSEEMFLLFPEAYVAQIQNRYRAKFAEVFGTDVGTDTFENIRAAAGSQWEFVSELKRVYEVEFRKQMGAA